VPEFHLMAQLLATLELSTWLYHTLSAVNSLAEGPFGVHYHSWLSAQLHLNLCSSMNSKSDCGVARKPYVRCPHLQITQLPNNKSECLLDFNVHLGACYFLLHLDRWTQDNRCSCSYTLLSTCVYSWFPDTALYGIAVAMLQVIKQWAIGIFQSTLVVLVIGTM
jgi:hypothetical protein